MITEPHWLKQFRSAPEIANTWLSICPCVEWFNFNWGFSALGLRLLFLTDQIIRFHMSKLNAQPENVLPLIEIERKIASEKIRQHKFKGGEIAWKGFTRLRILLYNCTQLDFKAKVIYGLGAGKKVLFLRKKKKRDKNNNNKPEQMWITFVAN